jgi:uncharacterized membrane protein
MRRNAMESPPTAPATAINPDAAPTANDRMLAAIGYPIGLVALIVLFLEGPKDRPYTRYHAIQALGANVAAWIVYVAFGIVYAVATSVVWFLACVLWIFFFVPFLGLLYYGYLAYTKSQYFDIPIISDLMKQQGWLKKP